MGNNITAKNLSVKKDVTIVARSKYDLTVNLLLEAGLNVYNTTGISFKDSAERRIYDPQRGNIGYYCASGESIVAVVARKDELGNGHDSYVMPNCPESVEKLEHLGFEPKEMPVPLSGQGTGQLKNKDAASEWAKRVSAANEDMERKGQKRPDTYAMLTKKHSPRHTY